MLASGNGSRGSPVGEIVQTNFGPDLCSQPKQVIFEEEKKGRDSVFIGPKSDHWLCLSLTNSLTPV